jgi:hypothetical protein
VRPVLPAVRRNADDGHHGPGAIWNPGDYLTLEQRYGGNAVDLKHQRLFADRGQGLTGRQLEYLGSGVGIRGV